MKPRRQYTFDELDASWEAALRFVEICRWQSALVGTEADEACQALKTLFKATVRLMVPTTQLPRSDGAPEAPRDVKGSPDVKGERCCRG
jgi:hypothetical protein